MSTTGSGIAVDERRGDIARATASRRAELTSVQYAVDVATVLGALPAPRTATRCHIVSADELDRDDLFRLDADLRGDTPGNDGWKGARPGLRRHAERIGATVTGGFTRYVTSDDHAATIGHRRARSRTALLWRP